MLKNAKGKLVILILTLAVALSILPTLTKHASAADATFVQDASRNDNLDVGKSLHDDWMSSYTDNEAVGTTIVNYIGNVSTWGYQMEAALKMTLPATTATLTAAQLRLYVIDTKNSPAATVTLTDDNAWQQTNDSTSSTYPSLSNPSVLANNEVISAGTGWKAIDLTGAALTALDAKIDSTANTVTFVITGSTTTDNYFNFYADDNADTTYRAQLVLTFAAPSSDATLKAASTVKGQTVAGLGTPNATLGSETVGTVTITAAKAADTSNTGSFITLFDKNNAGATVKVVKYATGASTTNFATDTAYANQVITDGDFFIIRVTAEDGSTIYYYKIEITVTAEGPDIWDGSTASAFADGDGTSGNPYQIATAEQLAYMASLINNTATYNNYYNKSYILTADLDLASLPWTPIVNYDSGGYAGKNFSGIFDGAGHTISNLAIGSAASPNTTNGNVGLFGNIYEGTVKDVSLRNVAIYSGKNGSSSGALAGAVDATTTTASTIINCYAIGVISGGNGSGYAGGLIGNLSYSNISGCYSAGSVSIGTEGSAGGLLGVAQISGSVTNCYSTCSVTAYGGSYPCAGGLIGYLNNFNVSNCYATGNIVCSVSDYTAGLVGYRDGGTLTDCYYSSTATQSSNGTALTGKGAGYGADGGTSKTAVELKDSSFVTLLNTNYSGVWTSDIGAKNQGYPVLTAVVPSLPVLNQVTYNANGATSGIASTDTGAYASGASIILAANAGSLAKTGSTFDGWSTQSDGGGTTYAECASYTISGNVTLYAKWNTTSPAPSSDATLKASSTVKGQTVAGLGTPNSTLGSETAGTVTITAAKAADTSNTGSFITLFDKNNAGATVKVVKYATGASTTNFATDTAYANQAITDGDFFIIRVTAEDTTTINYYRMNVTVTPAPSSDATLKAASTVKGQTVAGLGTPNATLGSETAGSVTITAAKAADTSNTGSFITLFDKNNAGATVKVVKYATGASTTNFATDTAYANQAITDGDFFIIRVTAEDTTTISYYRINVTVTPAPSSDATLKTSTTVKGQTVAGLGTPNATLGAETAGTVTITAAKAADTSNTGSFITLFDKNNAGATVKVVKYATGASTTNFATDTAYANQAITDGDFFLIRVTAEDTTTINYYRMNVTVTPAPSSDATLKAASTVKGQTVAGLGTPNSTLGSETTGTVTITAAKAADTSNTGSFITLFDKNNAGATVKVVKYATGASTTNFATDTAYANQAITDGDFFIIRVTAEDTTTISYYRMNVTVTPAPSSDATLKAASTVKGQTVAGLGTPNSTLGAETTGTVTITAAKAADTSNTGSFITLFDKNNAGATVKAVKYATGASTTNFATNTAYANQAITDGDFFIIRVTAEDTTTINYYRINVTVTPAPSSDATLKTSTTVKGQTVAGLGTPNATLGSETAGTVNITAAKAADTSNTGSFITLFDKNNAGATVKVVKYATGASTTNFATDTAYANQAITDGDFFIIRVTAEDTTTINYYRMNVTVTPAPSSDATLKTSTTVKGQTVAGLGTPNATLGAETAGTVTITAAKAADTSNTGSFLTLFDKNNAGATVKVVKYATGASTTNFATDTAYANQAITDGDFFLIRVTAEDTTTISYYRMNVTVTPAPSSDATLKSASTVKGQTVAGLGTPNATLGAETAGTVTITAAKAADTSNTGSFITLFDKNNAGATVKAVKYASGASTANIATDTAYANQAITDGDFFIIRVTAEDTTTINYYRINLTVTPAPTPSTPAPSSSGDTTQKPKTEVITVDVKNGDTEATVATISIERTTDERGNIADTVTYESQKAEETIEKLKEEGKDIARIVIPDSKNTVDETTVNIPAKSLTVLAEGDINLQIDTKDAKIDIPKASLSLATDKLDKDLYFNLVPLKEEEKKNEVENRAKFEIALQNNNEEDNITVLGVPVTIETNMPSSEVDITLPLTGVTIPTNQAEREAFLKQLGVYIEHSDGEKELVQGELVEYENGVYGIRFHINKFSVFTVVKTNAFLLSSECSITKVTVPYNAIIKGSNITAEVANEMDDLTVKLNVSDKAKWQLYSDKGCTKKVTKNKLKLKTGVNISFIQVVAESGTSKVYKLTIKQEMSSAAKLVRVSVPTMATLKGKNISATVASDVDSITLKLSVSNKASWKLYSNQACTKEIENHELSLTMGSNTAYIKVVAENGTTSEIYKLKITRESVAFNKHIKLGLIGSELYAKRIANIFAEEYDCKNVTVTKEGKYYRVTMDFLDSKSAVKACEDMISRKYIIHYYTEEE